MLGVILLPVESRVEQLQINPSHSLPKSQMTIGDAFTSELRDSCACGRQSGVNDG